MIYVHVVDERMASVEDAWADIQPLLEPLRHGHLPSEAFPMLRGVDDYGNTIFNTFQAPMVIEELRRMAPHTRPADKGALQKITAMAERVRDGTHLYLMMRGD